MAAHHRHVAGVIAHAVLLLVGLVVLLIDDNEAEIGIRQKQRRARADHDRDFAVGDGFPGAGALARRKFGMPFRRADAEARGETVEELRGERDLRHEDEALPAGADRVGHRFEINFGLARAGDAVEQRHRIFVLGDGGFQFIGGGFLIGGEIGGDKIRVGFFRDRLGRQHQRLQRALVDQAVNHAHGDAELARRVALAASDTVAKKFKHAPARRGHARRRRAGHAHTDPLAFGAEMFAHAQAHAQHHAARGHGVIGHPIDEVAQLVLERRQIELFLDVLEPVVEPRIGLGVLRPDHCGRLARAERHGHDVAGRQRQRLRHPVGIGPVEGDRDEDIDHAFGHVGLNVG